MPARYRTALIDTEARDLSVTEVTPGIPTLDVNILSGAVSFFTDPYDAITVTYPSATQEIYTSRLGGISGTVVQVLTVNYTDSSKDNLLNVSVV